MEGYGVLMNLVEADPDAAPQAKHLNRSTRRDDRGDHAD